MMYKFATNSPKMAWKWINYRITIFGRTVSTVTNAYQPKYVVHSLLYGQNNNLWSNIPGIHIQEQVVLTSAKSIASMGV